MTVICLDDTDSRERGMCTTYIGHEIAKSLSKTTQTEPQNYLIRLNPAAKHKTRGNAAVAIHTTASVKTAKQKTEEMIEKYSYPSDPETNPGAIIADEPQNTVTDAVSDVASFTEDAMFNLLDIEDAISVINKHGFETITRGNGRGRIGAVAALGAYAYFDDWTYEAITYRQQDNWKEERKVNEDSVKRAHREHYPKIWDNYDDTTHEAVCVPNTPCPVLYGIRGDDKYTVTTTANKIESEPKQGTRLYKSNQGTDAHIKKSEIGELSENTSYKVEGVVASEPTTKEGGHVFFPLRHPDIEDESITVAAFEPTKSFRKWVRDLRKDDVIIAFGEVTDDTLKLEKFKTKSLNKTELENPYCDKCEKSMASMGADQGYRCASCKDTADSKVEVDINRKLSEYSWYEVPPAARRHLSKPVVRNE